MPLARIIAALVLSSSCSVASEARELGQDNPGFSAAQVSVSAPDALKPLVGVFAFAGGKAERDALAAAIEAVVAEVNPLIRGVVRDRLTESCTIPGTLAVEAEERKVTVKFDERAYTATLDAAPVPVQGRNGDPLELSHRVDGKALVQEFVGKRGGRNNRILRSADKVKVSVRVHSRSLPTDLTYGLTFSPKQP